MAMQKEEEEKRKSRRIRRVEAKIDKQPNTQTKRENEDF